MRLELESSCVSALLWGKLGEVCISFGEGVFSISLNASHSCVGFMDRRIRVWMPPFPEKSEAKYVKLTRREMNLHAKYST